MILSINQIEEYSSDKYRDNDKVLKKKKEIIDLYINLLSHVGDNVKKGVLLKHLSDVSGIPVELLNTVKTSTKRTIGEKEEGSENKDKYLSYNEKLILKTLLNKKDEILKEFSDFDKIKGSVYFHYLLNMILGENIDENSEEYKEIQNFYEKVDTKATLEALHLLHKKWIDEEAEITAVLSFDKEEKGYVTYKELNDTIDEDILLSDELEALIEYLNELNIDVVEEGKPEELSATESSSI